jgi:hypothetical protein
MLLLPTNRGSIPVSTPCMRRAEAKSAVRWRSWGSCEGYRGEGVALADVDDGGGGGGFEVRGAGGDRVRGGGVEDVFCEVEAGAGEPLGADMGLWGSTTWVGLSMGVGLE